MKYNEKNIVVQSELFIDGSILPVWSKYVWQKGVQSRQEYDQNNTEKHWNVKKTDTSTGCNAKEVTETETKSCIPYFVLKH